MWEEFLQLRFVCGKSFNFFASIYIPGDLTGYFWGWGWVQQTDLGSTHVVEQLSFSLFLSILTFDFDSNLGSFLEN